MTNFHKNCTICQFPWKSCSLVICAFSVFFLVAGPLVCHIALPLQLWKTAALKQNLDVIHWHQTTSKVSLQFLQQSAPLLSHWLTTNYLSTHALPKPLRQLPENRIIFLFQIHLALHVGGILLQSHNTALFLSHCFQKKRIHTSQSDCSTPVTYLFHFGIVGHRTQPHWVFIVN